MSNIFIPGPAFLYFGEAPGLPGGSVSYTDPVTYTYLGQTQGDMQISEQMAEEDVHIDRYGPRQAFDVAMMGKEAFAGGTLIKYNENVWQDLAARTKSGVFGTVQPNEIGTLMYTERQYFKMAIVCPYQAKSAYTTQPPGYTFHCCWLHAAWDAALSVMVKRQRFAMRCIPEWQTSDASGILVTPTIPSGLATPDL